MPHRGTPPHADAAGELDDFWQLADRLVAEHRLVIDRPGGSRHPAHADVVYPFAYGYLDGTTAMDGGGIDCWRGSLPAPILTGIIATVDIVKADAEVKLLIGCTDTEMEAALSTHRTENQAAVLVRRERGASTEATACRDAGNAAT